MENTFRQEYNKAGVKEFKNFLKDVSSGINVTQDIIKYKNEFIIKNYNQRKKLKNCLLKMN